MEGGEERKGAVAAAEDWCGLAAVGEDGVFVGGKGDGDLDSFLTATEALGEWNESGRRPLCRWQTHLLRWS